MGFHPDTPARAPLMDVLAAAQLFALALNLTATEPNGNIVGASAPTMRVPGGFAC